MAQIYVTDETRTVLERVSEMDKRTMDGQINFLCCQRVKELGLSTDISPVKPQDTLQSE